ncbi:MAG: glycosyltransferase family 2 protein [Bacteroidales bacterium]|nr:glycosyltransferase family 2 protein [Bacteroidales bacterium]
MNIIPVTVIIPVKNEEKNLPNCLDKLGEFAQVIVVDSNSTDSTPEIVNKYGFEYYNFNWNGKFPKKRNWALRNIYIKNDWIFFLDADEYLTIEFIQELREKIFESKYAGFIVYYQNHFMGKKLSFGDKMKKLPIFKKNKGEYEKIDEDSWSHLDMEVHEHPIIEGEIGVFKNHILHNDYKGLEQYIARHNAYSTWEAKRYIHIKNSNKKHFTFRQRIKYSLFKSYFLPMLYFVYSYIIKLGVIDGSAGYFLAKYKANYFFQIRTKIIELSNRE